MRTMSVVLALAMSFCLTASAQDVGYLSPRGGAAFVNAAGTPLTTLDFSHPATVDGALTTDFAIGSPVTKTYGPNYFEQTTAQLFFNSAPLPAGGYIRIFPTAGSAFVYGSTTDNRTNDSQIQFTARR